jgi:hypothetical protein
MGRDVLVTLVLEGGTYKPGDESTVGGGTGWSCDQRKSKFTHEYREWVRKFHAVTRSVTNNKLYEMLGPHTEQVALAVMLGPHTEHVALAVMLGPHTEQVALAVMFVRPTPRTGMCSFRLMAVLTEVIRGLPGSLLACVGDITSGHDRYISNISKFIIHQSSYHPMLYTLR